MADTPEASGSLFKRAGAAAKGAAAPKPARSKPVPPSKRNSLAEGFGMVWGVGGGALAMRGNPAGRVMRVQAPMAGREFDRWVKKHPVVDSIFQPFLGADGLDFVSKVILPPLFVHVAWSRPEIVPLIQPVLMPMLYKLFVEVRREEAKMAEALADLAADPNVDGSAEFEAFLSALGLADDDTGPEEYGPEEVPGEELGEAPYAEDTEPGPHPSSNGHVGVEDIIGPPTVGANPSVG